MPGLFAFSTIAAAALLGNGPGDRGRAQGPAFAQLQADLNRGRLVLDRVRFLPAASALAPGADEWLAETARALSKASGRFVVVVAPEKERGFPPDTVLSRRRAEEAYRRLVSAGSSLERLVGLIQPSMLQPVESGQAHVEIVRIN